MFESISTQAHKLIKLASRKHDITSNVNSKTKLLTITSGKGGVGKSTFSANIAYNLSQKGYKVAVLDADIGLANMQVLLDLKPSYTYFDYLDGKVNLDKVLLSTKYENITLVAGKSGFQTGKVRNSFIFSQIIKEIVNLDTYDFLLIDTGAGLNEYVKEFLTISPNILAITTTDPSALTDVYALMKMLSKDKSKLMLCYNHTQNYKIGETITNSLVNLAKKNRLNNNFMVEYIGNVSTSKCIPTTARLRKLFACEFRDEQVCLELDRIIDALLNNIK
ncbi:MAG: P-loop NTPase [Campylobacteraceae bacterium]|nr:P-loop NTPase [Campylobacteraceae bacterium]